MFAKTITDSDAFQNMPLSTQALYFHLAMSADDDGFINNPKRIQRLIGANDDDFNLLILKHFIITFETGVIVIKHWKIHNYIRSDRYRPTVYQEEKSLLIEKENKAYTLGIPSDIPMVDKRYTQVSIGKDRLGEYRVVEGSGTDNQNGDGGDAKLWNGNVLLTEMQIEDLLGKIGPDTFDYYLSRLSIFLEKKKASVKSPYETILKWAQQDGVAINQNPKDSATLLKDWKVDYSMRNHSSFDTRTADRRMWLDDGLDLLGDLNDDGVF